MALKLNIPELQEHPVFIAETRPQKIHQSLLEMKSSDALETITYLRSELEILNRQKVSPSQRLQALDCFYALSIAHIEPLAEVYTNATLPLQENAKVAAIATESLWMELGYGYKLAFIDLQNQLIKLGTDKNSARTVQRAMHALAEQALVYYQTYQSAPGHIWADLHQLYFCAAQMGTQNINLSEENSKDPLVKNSPYACNSDSIESAYKHALLMSLAQPQHLTQQDIRIVAGYLAHHIQHAKITAIETLENSSGAFIVSLDSSNPPIPYNKQKSAPNPVSDVLLHTIDLVRNIHQDLNQLLSHLLPANGSISAGADTRNYIELLTYLIKNWGISPKRVFKRSTQNDDIELVAGIEKIHQIIQFASEESSLDKSDHSTFNNVRKTKTTPSRWKTLNISASGISIRRHHTAEKNIRIGCLIAICAKNEMHWTIGLVRWANCGTRDRLDIGIQLIAPNAQAAIARRLNDNTDRAILLLPEIRAVKQPATIVAPLGTYEPGLQLVIKSNNKSIQVVLAKLLERTHDIERIQFNSIS